MSGIVVGVDESDGAAAALRWAVREAELRSESLTAVLAWSYLEQHHVPRGPFDPQYGEDDARAALDAIVAGALGGDGSVTVHRRAVCDNAVPALLGAADDAELLVVGARGLGGFTELLLGSVSSQCLHHARCPVAIVRGPVPRDGRRPEHIVVGVDGSPASRKALAWAVDEARRRASRLTVVRGHLPPFIGGLPGEPVLAWDPAAAEDAARATLEAAVDAVDTTGVAVERLVVDDGAATAILAAAETADLVVLGSRGMGGFKGMLLGSVSAHVSHHATCPVVVLRSAGGPSAPAEGTFGRGAGAR